MKITLLFIDFTEGQSKSGGNYLRHQESDELQDTRNLRDEDLRTLAQDTTQRRLANVSSMPHLSRVSSINLTMLAAETKKKKPGKETNEILATLLYRLSSI